MKIKRIEISNFYSIKNIEFDIGGLGEGIVMIEGKNKDTKGSNGSGKSAVIEALVWGLFGRTIRKSTEEALVNNRTRKNCVVRIEVNDLVIERGKRPTFLRLYKNGEEITTDNATNTQTLIDELLNTNYKVFLASTIFGQQNNIEFLTATPDDKRTIIKNFLNLDDLFALRDSVKYLKSEYNQGAKRLTAILEEHQSAVDTYDAEINGAKRLLEEIDPELMDKCRDLTLAEVVAVNEHNQRIDWEIKDAVRTLKGEQKRAQDFLANARAKTCRSCGQKVKEAMDEGSLADKMAAFDAEIESIQRDLKELNESYKEVVVDPKDYSLVTEYKSIEDKIRFLEGQKEQTLEKLQNVYDERGDYNTNYEIMKFWEKAFSENGVVKFVIRNVLEYFNAKVNFYLSHLSQGKFFIEFDESLSETITHKNHTIHYISLSGGEKKKISLAVMLGLQSLLKISNTEDVNIMFFDEIAESLDAEGMEGLYILLSELKKSKTLYVITHNNYLKSLMDNAKTVTMIKSNGTSKLSIGK